MGLIGALSHGSLSRETETSQERECAKSEPDQEKDALTLALFLDKNSGESTRVPPKLKKMLFQLIEHELIMYIS